MPPPAKAWFRRLLNWLGDFDTLSGLPEIWARLRSAWVWGSAVLSTLWACRQALPTWSLPLIFVAAVGLAAWAFHGILLLVERRHRVSPARKHGQQAVSVATSPKLPPEGTNLIRVLFADGDADANYVSFTRLAMPFDEGTFVSGHFGRLAVLNGDGQPIEIHKLWLAVWDIQSGQEVPWFHLRVDDLKPFNIAMGRVVDGGRSAYFSYDFGAEYLSRIRGADPHRFFLRIDPIRFPVVSFEIPRHMIG